MPNPSQEPLAPTLASNLDLKDMDDLCIFEIKIESQNSEHCCIKDQSAYLNQIKMPNPIQDSPAPTKAPNQDLNDMDVPFTFKIKLESQNL